jgi:hypothetical protein
MAETLIGKAVQSLKNRKVQATLILGASVLVALAKKTGVLSRQTQGVVDGHPRYPAATSQYTPSPTTSFNVDNRSQNAGSGIEFDFTDDLKPATPPKEAVPTPEKPMMAELHAREHYSSQSTIHLGDYQLRLQRDNLAAIRLFVAVPITVQPSDIGGAYDLTALPLKRWYVVHDRRGFKLPVAVRRSERFSIQVRVDGLLPTHLPSILCIQRF